MSAFYFTSGMNKGGCNQAPSGLLIQTPPGGPYGVLKINGVDIALGSTAFLQAQPGGQMTVAMLAGAGVVTSNGQSEVVVQGAQTGVALDANGHAAGAPSPAVPIPNEPELAPLVAEINNSGVVEPTWIDSAQSKVIEFLKEQGLIRQFTDEQTQMPQLSPEEIQHLKDILKPANPPGEELFEYPQPGDDIEPAPLVTPVPARQMPTDGLWQRVSDTSSQEGTCSGADALGMGRGDGTGGPDEAYLKNPDNPTNQNWLCSVSGVRNFPDTIFMQGSQFRWNAKASAFQTDTYTDSSNTSVTQTIDVISREQVAVTSFVSKGQCTLKTTTVYRLYKPGKAYACINEAKQAEQQTAQQTGDQPTPVIEDPPPVTAGTYGLQWTPSAQCAASLVPDFASATLTKTDSGVTLVADGKSYGFSGSETANSYSYYDASTKVSMELKRRLIDDFTITYTANTNDGKSCSAFAVVTLTGAAADQSAAPPPAPAPSDVVKPGAYTAQWNPLRGDAAFCAAIAPTFTNVSLSLDADGNLVVDDGKTKQVAALQKRVGSDISTKFRIQTQNADGSRAVLDFTFTPNVNTVMVSGGASSADRKTTCNWMGTLTLQ
jgi:hypothetical protein